MKLGIVIYSDHDETVWNAFRLGNFSLNEKEQIVLNQYSNIKTRIYFILQLGYFKAKQQFFKFNFEDVAKDIEFIFTNYVNNTKPSLSGCISRDYLRMQKQDILKLFNYHESLDHHLKAIRELSRSKTRPSLKYFNELCAIKARVMCGEKDVDTNSLFNYVSNNKYKFLANNL